MQQPTVARILVSQDVCLQAFMWAHVFMWAFMWAHAAGDAGTGSCYMLTRAELESFLFQRTLLSGDAADELLGIRLRDLYAPAEGYAGDDAVSEYEPAGVTPGQPPLSAAPTIRSMMVGTAAGGQAPSAW